MKNSIMLAMAAALSLLAAAPASAAERRDSQRVAYDDLNLYSQRGALNLINRIELAAEAACGDRAGPMTLAERFAIRRCLRQKTEGAIAAVNNANVTSLYYGRRPNITVAGR